MTAMHWPGQVGMFLDTATPYFVIRSIRAHGKNGVWQGWAKDEPAATAMRERVKAGILAKSPAMRGYFANEVQRVDRLTAGQIAAVITGAEMADVLPPVAYTDWLASLGPDDDTVEADARNYTA